MVCYHRCYQHAFSLRITVNNWLPLAEGWMVLCWFLCGRGDGCGCLLCSAFLVSICFITVCLFVYICCCFHICCNHAYHAKVIIRIQSVTLCTQKKIKAFQHFGVSDGEEDSSVGRAPTEKPGTVLMWVQVPGAAWDFSPRGSLQCRLLALSIQPPVCSQLRASTSVHT